MAKTHEQIMNELKEKDPQMYEEIQKEIEQEQELIKTKKKLGIKLIPVKDSEGFYTKKFEDEITEEHEIISEKEYIQLVRHGGSRKNSGRKKIFEKSRRVTYEFEEETIIKLKDYAKKHKKSQNALVNEAVKRLINE